MIIGGIAFLFFLLLAPHDAYAHSDWFVPTAKGLFPFIAGAVGVAALVTIYPFWRKGFKMPSFSSLKNDGVDKLINRFGISLVITIFLGMIFIAFILLK